MGGTLRKRERKELVKRGKRRPFPHTNCKDGRVKDFQSMDQSELRETPPQDEQYKRHNGRRGSPKTTDNNFRDSNPPLPKEDGKRQAARAKIVTKKQHERRKEDVAEAHPEGQK